MIYLLSLLVIVSRCAEISVGQHDISLLQKKKIHCSMMSYHFLDYDMDTFQAFTEGFSQLRVDVFRSKVATKLSQNCQQRITNQQLQQLSQLIQSPTQGHEQQIQSLEHKYIEFFTPQQNIILSLLQQINHQSQQQVQQELNQYQHSRKQMQNHAQKVAHGFRELSQHIKHTAHHTVSSVNKFMESFLHLHGNVTTGWSKFSEDLMKSVQEIQGKVDQLHEHEHVKMVKGWWASLWEEKEEL